MNQQFSITINHLFNRDEDCLRVGFESQIIYVIPKHRIKDVSVFEELNNPGIYFLVGKHGVYIGQADMRENGRGLLGRITEAHSNAQIDDWDVAYALSSEMQYMNGPTQLNWLERNFYEAALNVDHYTVLNGKKPHGAKPDFMSGQKLITYMDNCLWVLKKYLACDIFVKGKKVPQPDNGSSSGGNPPPDPTPVEISNGFFNLASNKSGADATAEIFNYKRTVVKAGSVISKKCNLANQKNQTGCNNLRNDLINKGIIDNWAFTQDYSFSSTSTAATVILGTSSSGPDKWLQNSKKLSEIMEQESSGGKS